MPATEVSYRETDGTTLSVLEIVTAGRRSVLEPVRRCLFDLGVQIVRAESIVKGETLVERFHVSEPDGSELSRRRAAALRGAVRKAVRRGKRPTRSSDTPMAAG